MSTATRKTAPKITVSKAKAPSAAAPVDIIVAPDLAEPTLPEFKKKDLIEMVLGQGGIKKKHAKPVLDALLVALRVALEDGRDLNLPPLGKLKVTRSKDGQGAQVLTCRLRLSSVETVKKPGDEVEKPKAAPLAEGGE